MTNEIVKPMKLSILLADLEDRIEMLSAKNAQQLLDLQRSDEDLRSIRGQHKELAERWRGLCRAVEPKHALFTPTQLEDLATRHKLTSEACGITIDAQAKRINKLGRWLGFINTLAVAEAITLIFK